MCFCNPDKSVQIRVEGVVREFDDAAIKHDLVEKRPFLKNIEKMKGGPDFLALFLLEQCRAHVWTFESNLVPKEYIRFG